jgi:hypothetical protein
MVSLTLGADQDQCEGCGSGRECDICNTTRVPEYIDVTFVGLEDTYCNVQVDCEEPPTFVSTLILPHTSMNGTHRLYFNREITDFYVADVTLPDGCVAAYVSEEIEYGDAFIGPAGGCVDGVAPIDNEDRWYRNAKVQLLGFLRSNGFMLWSICDYTNTEDPDYSTVGALGQASTEWACDGGTSDEFYAFVSTFSDVTQADCFQPLDEPFCAPGGSPITSLTATASVAMVAL